MLSSNKKAAGNSSDVPAMWCALLPAAWVNFLSGSSAVGFVANGQATSILKHELFSGSVMNWVCFSGMGFVHTTWIFRCLINKIEVNSSPTIVFASALTCLDLPASNLDEFLPFHFWEVIEELRHGSCRSTEKLGCKLEAIEGLIRSVHFPVLLVPEHLCKWSSKKWLWALIFNFFFHFKAF